MIPRCGAPTAADQAVRAARVVQAVRVVRAAEAAVRIEGGAPIPRQRVTAPLESRFLCWNIRKPLNQCECADLAAIIYREEVGGRFFRFSLFSIHSATDADLFACPFSFVRMLDSAGRGARMRGENLKRTGGRFAKLTFPLSPLGFPLALPFPDSLTPLGRKPLV